MINKYNWKHFLGTGNEYGYEPDPDLAYHGAWYWKWTWFWTWDGHGPEFGNGTEVEPGAGLRHGIIGFVE